MRTRFLILPLLILLLLHLLLLFLLKLEDTGGELAPHYDSSL